jgi:hypothetical protein
MLQSEQRDRSRGKVRKWPGNKARFEKGLNEMANIRSSNQSNKSYGKNKSQYKETTDTWVYQRWNVVPWRRYSPINQSSLP